MTDSSDAPIDLVFGEDDEADHDQILLDIETPRGKPPDLTNLFQTSIEAPSIIVSEPDSAPQEEQIFDDNRKADTCSNVFVGVAEGVHDVGDVNAISADNDSNGQNENADNNKGTGKGIFGDENVHSESSFIEAADSNNSAANKDPLKTQNEIVIDKKDDTYQITKITDGNDKKKVESRSVEGQEPLRPMISSGVPSLSEKQKSTNNSGEESNEAYSTQSKEFSDLKQLDTEIKAVIETGKGIAHGDNTMPMIATDVSLSGIMMTEKQEEDSDDEFDFDLPPATQQKQGPTHPVPVSQTSAPKPPAPKPPAPELQAQGSQSSKPATVPSGSVGIQPSVGVVNSSRVDSREATVASVSNVITSPGAGKAAVGQKPVAIIKPTTQIQNVDVVSIPQTQPVNQPTVVTATFAPSNSGLEAAQDEWDKVTTIQAGFKGTSTEARGVEPTIVETVKPMSTYEFIEAMKTQDFSSVKGCIKCNVERRGLSAFVNLLFGPPKLHRDLLSERERVFCIAASQLSNDNSIHMRTLQTIYKSLTGSKFDCPRMGSHWEEIGFQGMDPSTDLRGAGLLGLMNLLYILKDPKKMSLASDIYRLSIHPTQNFPFCVMGINLSRITLQTLREDLLNKECNRRGDVMSVVNEFYAALYFQMYQVWKTQGKTISDSGYVIKELEIRAKKNPRDILRHLDEYLNRKTMLVPQVQSDAGGDNFTNVCDD